jgi:hypothetical protein
MTIAVSNLKLSRMYGPNIKWQYRWSLRRRPLYLYNGSHTNISARRRSSCRNRRWCHRQWSSSNTMRSGHVTSEISRRVCALIMNWYQDIVPIPAIRLNMNDLELRVDTPQPIKRFVLVSGAGRHGAHASPC